MSQLTAVQTQADHPLLDQCQLHRLSVGGLGDRFPWWHYERERQVARAHLGRVGGDSRHLHRHQLSSSEVVLGRLSLIHGALRRRLPALRNMVANWRLKDLRVPFRKGCLHDDSYVPAV